MTTMQQPKKNVKVSFQGETKRLKLTGDYQELISRVKEAWSGISDPIKFFYIDEENEIISITSQSDFKEALEIEDLSSLKLTVAASVGQARTQLQSQIQDHQSLGEVLNNANASMLNQSRTFREKLGSEFEFIASNELESQSSVQFGPTGKPVTHEMSVGGDGPIARGLDMGTDVNMLVGKDDQGCNTMQINTCEKMIDTCVETTASGTQARAVTRDAGNDGFATVNKDQGVQMTATTSDAQANCNLIVPDEDEDEDVQEITCIKCNGSQVNKKGLPCRKCGGSGVLTSKELAAVAETVRAEVRSYCLQSFQGMFVNFLEKKRIEQAGTVHDNFVCDGCGMTPIKGIRYMCSVCSNFDICDECEAKGVHSDHAMLKIRKPELAPAKLICQYKSAEMKEDPPLQKQAPPPKKHKNPKYEARFVKESIFDKHEVAPGTEFTKTWIFRNDGETSWPADVQFLQTTGDDIGAKPYQIGYEVKPETDCEVTVMLKAPENEGKYTSYFRMQTGSIKFGHKVWCDILVVKPKQPAAVNKVLQEPAAIVDDEEMKEEVSAFQPSDKSGDGLMQSELKLSSQFKTPKMVYYENVAKETDAQMREALTSLYEFGFNEFNLNKKLMFKHKDVNTVAEKLCSGDIQVADLTESTIADIQRMQ